MNEGQHDEGHPPAQPAPFTRAEPPSPTIEGFGFDGLAGSFFVLYLKNIVLTILTLGIYKFWADVEVKRFLFGHTYIWGGRFGYHATGKEKLLGFLKGILLLLPIVVALVFLYQGIAPNLGDENALNICIYVFFFIMFLLRPLIVVGTQAFNLSRSSWNNLRFRFVGQVKALYLIYLKDLFFIIITFGIYTAWHHVNVRRFTTRNSRFGRNHFDYDATGGPLLATYSLGFILTPLTLGLYLPWFMARLHRFHINHTHFQDKPFESSLGGARMFGFLFIAVLAVLFTVGLALPWVIVRYNRLVAETTTYQGDIDLDAIQADFDAEANATLEGLGEAGEALESLGEMFGG